VTLVIYKLKAAKYIKLKDVNEFVTSNL